MTKIEIKDWLIESTALLSNHSEFPFIETQVLLAFVTGKSREWLIGHPDVQLTDDQLGRLSTLRARLIEGEPLPYLTGKQAFFGLDFAVDNHVLIPRPETELLVGECIQWLNGHPSKRKMVDVGTGSGAIAVILAHQFNDLDVTAIDCSAEALAIASENAKTYYVDGQVHFLKNDLLTGLEDRFDLIAANLPYIPSEVLKSLTVSKYEPRLALDGGADGLGLIRQLIEQSKNRIKPGGLIILEIETSQSAACLKLAENAFPLAEITPMIDLAKHPRIIKIQL